jgi:hypothetical protein
MGPTESDRELVKSADAIVLARVTSIEPAITIPVEKHRKAIVHLEVTESIKGVAEPRLILKGYERDSRAPQEPDFNSHHEAEFWAGHASNSVSPGDCRHYGIFSLHGTYLIFIRKDSHWRAFENIRSEDDLWLQVVRLLAGAKQPRLRADMR